MISLPKVVVFTDLDGTLLDCATYSYAPAVPALELLHQKRIPVIFCSAKTRAEQEVYRDELNINAPFIVENGGAIFIGQDYFPFAFDYDKTWDRYLVIELGVPYKEIRRLLEKLRSDTGINFRGFGDMSVEEIAMETGLDLDMAHRAKEREYDETIKLEGSQETIKKMLNAIEKAGLNHARGGTYYSVMRGSDKGKAAAILVELFRRKLGNIQTIGVGDGLNDQALFEVVDIPILVEKPEGQWEQMILPRLRRVAGIGPVGWKRAMEELIRRP